MINSYLFHLPSRFRHVVGLLLVLGTFGLLHGQTSEMARVYKPCGLLQPTKMGCFIEQHVPVYRPFGRVSQPEFLYLPDEPSRQAPAYALTRDRSQWLDLIRRKPERLVVELPVGMDSVMRLYLESNSLTNQTTPSGLAFEGAYYFGTLLQPNGHLKSSNRLAVSFFEDRWVGVMIQGNQSWVLADIPNASRYRLDGADQVMFSPLELPDYFKFSCGVNSPVAHDNGPQKGDAAELHNTTTCKQVNILLVIDYFTRNTFASNAQTINWITGIFNAVKFIFSNENMTINIYDIDILQSQAADPFDACNSTNSMLQVAEQYAQNRTGSWDLLHVCSKRPLGGGMAYLPGLCQSNKAVRTGVSCDMDNTVPTVPFPSNYYTWNVLVLAHELGHNFGSPHTQSCTWPGGAIDGCWLVEGSCTQPPPPVPPFKGTIMSYCHLNIGIDLNQNFGPLPGNRMRNQVQQSTCLSSISVKAQITSPTGPAVSICAGDQQLFTTAPCTNCDYQWFRNNQPITGANNATYAATTSGVYFVRTSNGGCAAQSASITVNVTGNTVTASANPPSLSCPGNVQLCASGASTYRWNPGNLAGSCITRNLTQTSTYTVTGTTGNCTSSATVTVTVGAPPTLTASATPNPRCGPGQVTLTATGANTFRWMPGNITGSPATLNINQTTTFTVTGTSGNCSNSATVTVQVLPALQITAAASPATVCPGGSTTLTASGAQSYTWLPGNLSGNSVVVNPNQTTTYTVTGVSGNCTNTAAVTVTVPTGSLVITANNTNLPCPGQVTMTASGANQYTWQPGSYTTATVSLNLLQTTTFTVTGRQGSCSNTATLTLTVGPGIQVQAAANPASLCQAGSVTLTATGANTYRWMPGNIFGSTITRNLSQTTTYTVTGTAGNCTNSTTVTVTVGAGPALNPTASPATSCPGQPVTLSASNASSYTWLPGNLTGSSVTVNPTQTTTYTVQGVQGSCTTTATVRVTVPTGNLDINASATSLPCPGQVNLNATGANSYVWLPNNISSPGLTENLQATKTYTVIGTTGSCTNSASLTVTVGQGLSIEATATPSTLCSGGRVQLSASGATTYLWRPGNVQGAVINRNVNQTTTYTVTGTTGNCTATATVTVTVGSINLTATANPTLICPGGSTTLTATGANSYIWMPMNQNGPTLVVNPQQTTTYTLLGFAASCSGTATVTVQVAPAPEVVANVQQHAHCNQPGLINASCVGSCDSPKGYTFSWQPGNIGPNQTGILQVSPAQTTTYTVTIRDEATGCTSSFSNPTFTTIQVIPCNTELDIYYPFCAGDPWKDQGVGGYHPVPTGAITSISGERGSAVLFDNPLGPAAPNPTPKYLTVPTLPAVFDQGITISALVRFDNPANGQHERIFEMGNGPGNHNVLFANSGGILTVHTHNPPLPSIYYWAGNPIPGKFAWYTAVLTPNSIAIYVNGQLAGSQTYAQDIYSNVVRNVNLIARSTWYIFGYDSDLSGAMDEFRLLNRALTSAEVADLFSQPGWIEATPNPVCQGGTAQLKVIEHPRTSLFWPHNSSTSAQTTATVQLPTNFTCHRTYPSGCVDLPATVQINTFTIPSSISGLASNYSSSDPSVTLTGTPTGGTFVGPGMSGNTFTPALAGVGTHVICYTGTLNGCTYNTCQPVNVVPPPTCPRPSQNFYYTNISNNSYTFNWGSVPQAQMYELEVMDMSTFQIHNIYSIVPMVPTLPIVSFTVTGLRSQTMYRNRLRSICAGNVYSPWTTQNFFSQTLRQDELPRNGGQPQLLAYPNPTRGPVSLQLSDCPIGTGHIAVHSLTGQQVWNQTFETTSNLESLNLDLSDLAAGVYSLAVELEGHSFQPVRIIIAQ